jgi:5S rRNA maturation endonuclease (ribonuclease M5)
LLKSQIAIKTQQWNEKQPGYVEADTVAHCGTSLLGSFIWSLTLTDIYSGWTENAAVWNKGAHGVLQQIEKIEKRLPFSILGFDSDNGGEFLNYHLLKYFKERNKPVQFTRSRPYHKGDNAHVEQKNWTHVRQLFGYYRLENADLVELMNDLYQNEFALLHNYFCPAMKLKDKTRIDSKIIKKYDQPQTPYQRLMQCEDINDLQKEKLKKIYLSLNPFELKDAIEKKLKYIFKHVDLYSRKKVSSF